MIVKTVSKRVLPIKWRQQLREFAAGFSIKQLHGPETVGLDKNEAVVTCVVKNGEFYISQFIEHYLKMGFRHIFFLDNGSTDNTVSVAAKHKHVSVCQSHLPIDGNQRLFKKYLAYHSGIGGWCLDADIDELFDYPFSRIIGLREFLVYLNQHGFTAVLTQLLDMFSERPLSHLLNTQLEDLKNVYRYYDLANIVATPYRESELVAGYGNRNELPNENAALLFGGIRRVFYGKEWLTNCLLTKHSLFYPTKGADLFPHVHFVNNLRVADVSCPMLHFKLTCNALETALQNQKGFLGISKGYSEFADFLIRNPNYQIKRETAVEYQNAEALVASGFLFGSEQYREYVRNVSEAMALPGWVMMRVGRAGACFRDHVGDVKAKTPAELEP